MTTRQRSQITPAEKTLAQLQAAMPFGPAHVTALSLNGPWQIQTAKVSLATCRDRTVAEYFTRLWNTIAPAKDPIYLDGPADGGTVTYPVSIKPRTRRRKAGKSVQVVP